MTLPLASDPFASPWPDLSVVPWLLPLLAPPETLCLAAPPRFSCPTCSPLISHYSGYAMDFCYARPLHPYSFTAHVFLRPPVTIPSSSPVTISSPAPLAIPSLSPRPPPKPPPSLPHSSVYSCYNKVVPSRGGRYVTSMFS